jgi:hypothetical protein
MAKVLEGLRQVRMPSPAVADPTLLSEGPEILHLS